MEVNLFDQLFRRRQARQRHTTSPLLQERLGYLQHCASEGYLACSLRAIAADLLLIQNLLGLPESSQKLDPADIKAAIEKWATREPKHFNHRNGRRGRENLTQRAIRWLRYMDRLRVSSSDTGAHTGFVADFAGYMRVQRGLSEETIKTRCWYVNDFLEWSFGKDRSLSDITIADIDEAIARKGRDDGYSRLSVQVYASGIRNFFRHAERRGWCRRGLADLIEAPRVYQYESLPRGPSWDDVQRLIATTEKGTPKDLRDRAMLLLLAVYGLRSGEVRTLRLEHLDWEKNLIWVPRAKGRRTQCYPLAETIGEAILRYLENGRPKSSGYREVFLTVEAPIQPLRRSSVWTMVAKRLQPLGLPLRQHGPHVLRHACATHLLAQGLSLKEIGDHLGQRLPKTTAVYAKVNMAGLREVANFSLGGLA
jgi:site-specific recombinase XerD